MNGQQNIKKKKTSTMVARKRLNVTLYVHCVSCSQYHCVLVSFPKRIIVSFCMSDPTFPKACHNQGRAKSLGETIFCRVADNSVICGDRQYETWCHPSGVENFEIAPIVLGHLSIPRDNNVITQSSPCPVLQTLSLCFHRPLAIFCNTSLDRGMRATVHSSG